MSLDQINWRQVPVNMLSAEDDSEKSHKTFSLVPLIEQMTSTHGRQEYLTEYNAEQSRTFSTAGYGFMSSNVKGLLSVSNGNDIVVLNIG